MAMHQNSAMSELIRLGVMFAIAFFGFGVLLHFTLGWFDFGTVLGTLVDLAVSYPEVTAVIIGFGVIFFGMAAADDALR